MYYTYHRISREVYDYCIKNKLVDAALIAKWKKTGYEKLCSTYVINPRNYKFGTVSICRVPKHSLAPGTYIEDPVTGCRGCFSGPGGQKNIFGNKYGQYLAAIQIAREERQKLAAAVAASEKDVDDEDVDGEGHSDDDDDDENDDGDDVTGDLKKKERNSIWAADDNEISFDPTTASNGMRNDDGEGDDDETNEDSMPEKRIKRM